MFSGNSFRQSVDLILRYPAVLSPTTVAPDADGTVDACCQAKLIVASTTEVTEAAGTVGEKKGTFIRVDVN